MVCFWYITENSLRITIITGKWILIIVIIIIIIIINNTRDIKSKPSEEYWGEIRCEYTEV